MNLQVKAKAEKGHANFGCKRSSEIEMEEQLFQLCHKKSATREFPRVEHKENEEAHLEAHHSKWEIGLKSWEFHVKVLLNGS